jgi:methylenetetrahydrofolate dehydrogenase (NADP+) / methenyltetrahydrofolate cyclohydrolase
MIVIDGKKTASDIKNELKEKILKLKENGKGAPGLVAILVGDDPASKIYVTSKGKACEEIGMKSKTEILPANISQDELLGIIDHYNSNIDFHGILVQLPLPKHIDENKVIERISPEKDVDGFHPVSVGNLVIGKDTFASCTPAGIQELLKRYEIQTEGKHVVVVGRSNIVGKPIANIMLQKQKFANAVVTICHSAASDLAYFTRQADILIAAIGRANFIKDNMVKEGAVVIDVGINRIDAPETTKGYKIVGDVEFETVSPKTSFITPVPGGVGPMTIAMLLSNTFKSFEIKINKNI